MPKSDCMDAHVDLNLPCSYTVDSRYLELTYLE